jgi:uncharacterized protein (TIGR02118 family)
MILEIARLQSDEQNNVHFERWRRIAMAGVKVVALYPRPRDEAAFEKLYIEEHIPMAVAKLQGKTKMVATKIKAMPDGSKAPFHRIAEIHFPSLEALQACLATPGGKETVAHAIAISSGGPPIIMIAAERAQTFA